MDMSLLFEAYMIFYTIECAVLIAVAAWYLHEPRQASKKIWDPWGIMKEFGNGRR